MILWQARERGIDYAINKELSVSQGSGAHFFTGIVMYF